jgi:hypothetical protein
MAHPVRHVGSSSVQLDGFGFRALVGRHLPLARRRAAEQGGWRGHVDAELGRAVACSDPEDGFLWLRCNDCRVNRVVALSCKGRGFCPRCGGRRMSQGAANLVDRVLPRVGVRQWVLSLPMRHRLLLAWRPELVGAALGVLVRAVERFYATHTDGGRTGSVTVVQRFGSALNLNVHFHVLFLDGGYVRGSDGTLVFRPSPPPTQAELQVLVKTVAKRVDRLLARRGFGADTEVAPEDLQAELQLASASGREALGGRPGSRTRRVAHVRPFERAAGVLEASHDWFSLHAGTRVRAADRKGLELLARYVLRPAVALARLSADPDDDTVTVTLRHPWSDGTGAIELDPVDFVGRLAALVPPPRRNLTRYHGVLAPAHPWRREVVPDPPPPKQRRPTWMPWASLVLRVFERDPLACARCGGAMTSLALVRAGASGVLAWLGSAGEVVLHGPPARGDPGAGLS